MAWLRRRRPRASGRWTLAAAGLAALCWWLLGVGCASGNIEGDDDDGSGASGNSGGGGSTTTSSTSSGSGASTSSTTSSTGGFGGGPCTYDPCKLTPPQCGCDPGKKCFYNTTLNAETCVDEGTVGAGEQCLGSGCVAGYLCAGFVGPPEICRQYCYDDDDCAAPGGICLEYSSGGPPMVCTENCDPATQTGCSVVGTKCDALLDSGPPERNFTICLPAGSGQQGQACTGLGQCAAGLSCFTVGSNQMCLTWCNMSNPQCPTGSCNSLTPPAMIGATEYGVCQ